MFVLALTLPYPSSSLVGEIILMFVLVPIEVLRQFLGKNACKYNEIFILTVKNVYGLNHTYLCVYSL